MPVSGRRPADPPFPAAVRLLGRLLPLTVERRVPWRDRVRLLRVVRAAAAKLAAEHAARRLSAGDRQALAALTGFALGPGRSGQHRGLFIFGLADLRASQDVGYWSSALVHDGVHAQLQARGRPYGGELAPCAAQLGYLQRTGGDPAVIASVEAFRDSRARQRARAAESL